MRAFTFLQYAAGLCILFVSGAKADVTVKAPDPNLPGATQIISASFPGVSSIGVQPNGATIYVGTEIDSFAGIASDGATATILNAPATAVVTFIEGSSIYSASLAVTTTVAGKVGTGAEELVCTGDINAGDVSCVEALAVSIGTIATAVTTTFSASMIPVFTISATGTGTGTGAQGQAQPTPTKSQSNGIRAKASLPVFSFVAGALVMAVFF